MKNVGKRLASLLLCICLMVAGAPVLGPTAFAQEEADPDGLLEEFAAVQEDLEEIPEEPVVPGDDTVDEAPQTPADEVEDPEAEESVAAAEVESAATYIKLNTEVNPMGHYPVSFELTLSDPSVAEGVKAEDFVITGKNRNWLGVQSSFTVENGRAVYIEKLSLNGDVLTLYPGAFPERYYLMDEYTVACTNEVLTFTMADLDQVVTPGMDLFEYVVSDIDDKQFNYYLYTPEDTDGPQPLVLFNHGMSDRWTLQANRWVVTFAESHNQAKNPSYVLAPQYEDVTTGSSNNSRINANFVNDEAAKLIREMIDEGKVDPNRIYVVGKSMGGSNSYRTLDRHNDLFTAGLICCASTYSFTNGTAAEMLGDLPVWIVYSEGDSTSIVNNNRNIYNSLMAAGAFKAKSTELTVEEVDARMEGEYHGIELVVTESDEFIDWLYAQTKEPVTSGIEYAKAYAAVEADGQYIHTIQLLADSGRSLPALAFSIDGEAVDASVEGNVVTLSGLHIPVQEEFAVSGPEGFSFGSGDLRDIITETVDDFMQYSEGMSNGYNFDHSVYAPAITPGSTVGARETRPLVVVLSDAEDNLRDNRIVTAWAEQEDKPAYVLAPSLGGENALENTLARVAYYASIDLIDQVYVAGNDVDAVEEFLQLWPDAEGSITFTAEEFAAREPQIITRLLIGEVPVETINLNAGSLNMLSIGKTLELNPTITPANATEPEVTYTSNNPKVASVDENGVVAGLKTGTALITATSSNGKVSKTTVRITY